MHGLFVSDPVGAWEALGFAPSDGRTIVVGSVALRCGEPPGWALGGGSGPASVDGIRTVWEPTPWREAPAHPNGAGEVDHVVVFTDSVDRTAAAIQAADGDLRRRAAPPDVPVEMAFLRLGGVVVEVAQAGGPTRIWGLTVTVADVDALAARLGPSRLGEPRPAVQPGRRIATARGLETALAFITPRVRTRPLPPS